jgi:hypothetical protein
VNLAQDAQLIDQIQKVTQAGSRLLVTLARRGKALQQDEPQRAAFLLGAMGTHPLYKGGRLAFDMMEIEDLILDNPLVDPMSTDEVIRVVTSSAHHVAETLRQIVSPAQHRRTPRDMPGSDNDMSMHSASEATAGASLPRVSLGPIDVLRARSASATLGEGTTRNAYPELRSSDYLYDYVVLGLLDVVGDIRMFPS